MGRSTATDALPHDVVVELAKGAAKVAAAAAGSEVAKATIRGAKKIIEGKKAKSEKPTIILTDDD